jgi:tetratricopeptide (TPR) repeat protein
LIEGAAGIEPDWRVVARHFEFAQRFDDAVTAYQKASIDARRRGALQEALICLTNALDRLTQCKPGPARDRAEIHIRLERGFLAGAAQGSWSGEGPADLERCLELASAGMHEDELFASLYSLIGYYHPRAELRRAHDLLDSLSQQPVTAERAWSAPALSSTLGTVLWLEGDFEAARGHLLDALDARSAADPRELATAWWVATDPISAAHNYLALTYIMSGDLDRADIELAQSVRRCEELEYPQNAFNRAMTYFHEIWVRLESSRVDEAATLVSGMRSHAEASGLDLWLWVSATQNATTKALAELSAGADDAVLTSRAENIVRRVDASRLMELNVYLTFHDAVIARLLIAAGSHDKARERLDMSLELAERSGMHFHDAELMRLRAHALAAPDAQRNALADALAFARRQGAMLFELRCLLDGFELLGDGDRSALAEVLCRFPGDARWPERVRAERILS